MFFNHVEEAREELREQVYDAMGEKEEAKKTEDKSLVQSEIDKEQETEMDKGGREEMDISEPAEELQEKVESTPDLLTETTEEAKGTTAPEGLNEAEVTSGKLAQEAPDAEEGKSISATDIQEEYQEKGGQEKQGEVIVSIEERPKTSDEQSVVTLEKQGTAVELETEPIDPSVNPVGVGGDEPKEQVAASENEPGKAGQEVPPAEGSPKVTTEATEASAAEARSEASEKPGQEATVLPQDGAVNGLSAADQTPLEPETHAEGLTETKDGSGLEEEVRAELVPNQEATKLSVEESWAAGDGVETKVAQGATEKFPEDKDKIAANEETQEKEEQMKEGEGNRDMQELQWVEYILDLTH